MLPMGIGLAHAFHHHDTFVCSSLDEQHVHKDSPECNQLHYFIQTSDASGHNEITIHYVQWAQVDQLIRETQFTISFYKEDPDRGPPSFNVL